MKSTAQIATVPERKVVLTLELPVADANELRHVLARSAPIDARAFAGSMTYYGRYSGEASEVSRIIDRLHERVLVALTNVLGIGGQDR